MPKEKKGAAPTEALDKKTLNSDPLQTFLFRVVDYYDKHRKWVVLGVAALLVVVLGGVGAWQINRYLALQQAEEFYRAEKLYYGIQVAPAERKEKGHQAFVAFVESHSRSALTPFACMYLARMAMENNQSEEVAQWLTRVAEHGKSPDGLVAIALSGLAKLREDKGQWKEAQDYYKDIPDSYKDLQLKGQARLALAQNQPEVARKRLEELQAMGRESALSNDAAQSLLLIP